MVNKDQYIAEITEDKTILELEAQIEKGIGFVSKEERGDERAEVGTILLDALYSPVRKANYSVENMRVGDRTDFNRLIISIQTDGTITPRDVFEKTIKIMVQQLKSIVDIVEEEEIEEYDASSVKISDLNLSAGVIQSIEENGIKTIAGLTKKTENEISEFPGVGAKAIENIMSALAEHGATLKK